VAFAFTLIDVSMIYAFFYYFFDRLYGIVNISAKSSSYIDYIFFSVTTLTTLGCDYITPTKTLAKVLVISEVGMGIFLLVLIINTGLVHYRRLYEKL